MHEANKGAVKSLLTIFTTFEDTPEKYNIHRNVILNWAQFMPKVKPFLFSNLSANSLLNKLAVSKGWTLLQLQGSNNHGTPFLKNMYNVTRKLIKSSFYGYCNGDILFNHGLISTLDRISQYSSMFNSTLVIGRRINVNINGSLRHKLFDSERVSIKAKRQGNLFSKDAQDFFFIGRPWLFPWHTIKDVVIGRPAYDNYFVGQAIQSGVAVIDATKTIVAMHQTSNDGNKAGHHKGTDNDYNKQIIGPYNYNLGGTDSAQYVTSSDILGRVYIQQRNLKQRKQ